MCVSNRGYPASLEVKKIYRVLPDPDAEKLGLFRIVDESGTDYLYPQRRFGTVELSEELARIVSR